MKKMLFILIAGLGLASCAKKKPFESVKTGMTKAKVIELVGEPESKQPMVIAEWWEYPKDNKLIVMGGDTVVRMIMDLKSTQDSMAKAMKELEKFTSPEASADTVKVDSAK